jgi:hypothetical protein
MELMGALLAVRLARKISDLLKTKLDSVWYFTNSTAVLGMILRESATYQEFVGTMVSQIKLNSKPEKDWFWIPKELNLADMGTRPTVVPKDMELGIPYQEGLPWMRDPPRTWPTRKTYSPPPPEECKKDMLGIVGAVRRAPGLWYSPPSGYSGQAGVHLLICVCLSGPCQEAQWFYPIVRPAPREGQGGRSDIWTAGGDIQRSCEAAPAAGCAGEYRPGWLGRSGYGDQNIQL